MLHAQKKGEKYILPSLKVLPEGDVSINRLEFDIEVRLGEVWGCGLGILDGHSNLPSSFILKSQGVNIRLNM